MAENEVMPFETVAELVGRAELANCDTRNSLQGTTFVLDGYGSVSRPISEELTQRGAQRFIITDPKPYVPESVWSQCMAEEVGRLKVDVGAERLQALGARVTPYARDIDSVPDGVVTPDSIVITTVDNRRADILSNRRAARMGARLIKVNVEPALGLAAVRAYDFRQETSLCVECQFSDHHYAAQRHPRSCDGTIDGRRTNSPRWLSLAAARLGAIVAIDLAADQSAAKNWFGREWQYVPEIGLVRQSRLEPKQGCRWDHAVRWEDVVRLATVVDDLSLRSLLQSAKLDVDVRTKIRFCQQIALRGRCSSCHRDVPVVHWLSDLQSPVGSCPDCDGVLVAVPFAVFRDTSLEPLLAVLDKPLWEWGVEPLAVIELSRAEKRKTFVVPID